MFKWLKKRHDDFIKKDMEDYLSLSPDEREYRRLRVLSDRLSELMYWIRGLYLIFMMDMILGFILVVSLLK